MDGKTTPGSPPSAVSEGVAELPKIDRSHSVVNQLLTVGHDYEDIAEAIHHCGYDFEAADERICSRSTTVDKGESHSTQTR